VKEMRLSGIETLEEANVFLKKYLIKHNKKFSVSPLSKENAHKEKKENRNSSHTPPASGHVKKLICR
jgi:hypothetical protein